MEIIGENELLSAIKSGTLITNGREDSCEGIKYDFTLSKMALTVESKMPRDIQQSNEPAVIKPGEIAFVMTEETLALPDNVYCQLSTKRKLSLDGIITLGGLIIDPNYKGKLIFGLYNLSSNNYLLLPGKKLVAGVFFRLDKNSGETPEPIDSFPEELIKTVVNTKPNSASAINAAISDITGSLNELRAEMQDIKKNISRDDQWKLDFQNKMTNIMDLVEKMGEKLDTEIDTRKGESIELRREHVELKNSIIPLSQTEKRFQLLKGALITVALGVLIGVIVFIITR